MPYPPPLHPCFSLPRPSSRSVLLASPVPPPAGAERRGSQTWPTSHLSHPLQKAPELARSRSVRLAPLSASVVSLPLPPPPPSSLTHPHPYPHTHARILSDYNPPLPPRLPASTVPASPPVERRTRRPCWLGWPSCSMRRKRPQGTARARLPLHPSRLGPPRCPLLSLSWKPDGFRRRLPSKKLSAWSHRCRGALPEPEPLHSDVLFTRTARLADAQRKGLHHNASAKNAYGPTP